MREIPELLAWFNTALATAVFPFVARVYGVDASKLRVIDAFLVKYDAAKQRSLPLHCDQSEYSITLPLNSQNDYDGGGTYFHSIARAVNAQAGGLVAFPGHLTHGASQITRGRRYVIVAFLYEYKDANDTDRDDLDDDRKCPKPDQDADDTDEDTDEAEDAPAP